MTFIYGLICPLQNKVRYIGKTKDIDTRLKKHIGKAKTKQTTHHCARWINTLLRAGLEPTIQVLYVVQPDESWQECEARLIKHYRDLGYPLTNMTAGGDGFHDLPAESIKRRVKKRKITMSDPQVRERWLASRKLINDDPQYRARQSDILKKTWSKEDRRQSFIAGMNTPAALEKRAAATKRRYEDEEQLQRHCEKMKEVFNTPEAKIAQSKRSKDAWANPERRKKRISAIKKAYESPHLREEMSAINAEIGSRPSVKAIKSAKSKAMWKNNRAKLMEGYARPEVKKPQSEKRIAAWADPVVGSKLRAIHASPESRKKKSDAAKARNTPEYRALLSEKLRLAWERRRAKQPLA